MSTIAILFHGRERDTDHYLISQYARFWREDGHRAIEVACEEKSVMADIGLLHVDLSVVPDEYLHRAKEFPIALNAAVSDIRKRTISENTVRPKSEWSGPVIVKSNLNFRGLPERCYRGAVGTSWTRLVERAYRKFIRIASRHHADEFLAEGYTIYRRLSDVPKWVFQSEELIVERFLPETQDGLYHIRMLIALGNRYQCVRLGSKDPVVKAHNSVTTETIETDMIVHKWRETFQLDYGKIDYVVYDGVPILLDVNKTVGATSGYRDADKLSKSRRYIAEGLYDYVSGRCQPYANRSMESAHDHIPPKDANIDSTMLSR